MDKKVLKFLGEQRVCGLSVLLPNGIPHSAAMHFSFIIDPLRLFFSADVEQRKSLQLKKSGSTKSSVVIGFNEEEWKTLQLDGEIRWVRGKRKIESIKKVHYKKNPTSKKFENEPGTIFLEFIPKWWRYTDFNTDPITILSSK